MAKIFGFTPLELREGVRGEGFEQFWLNKYAPIGTRLGWKSFVLKADRGVRKGKYAVTWEFEYQELRDRFSPEEGKFTDECMQLIQPDFDIANEKQNTFVADWPGTNYVEISNLRV